MEAKSPTYETRDVVDEAAFDDDDDDVDAGDDDDDEDADDVVGNSLLSFFTGLLPCRIFF